MGIYSLKPAFRRRLVRVQDALVDRGVSADTLTSMALLLSVAGGACIAWSGQVPALALAVPFLALLRITLNALDGMVAVATGTARPAGEFFNELADRLADISFYGGIAMLIEPVSALAGLAVVLTSSFAGVLAKAAGADRNYSGVFGKADRMIALSVVAVAAFFLGPQWFAYFSRATIGLATITLMQRIGTTMKALGSRAP